MAPTLLSLPNELLLKVFSNTDERPRDRQKHLRNLSLVCQRFLPIAQEVLLEAPTVHYNDVPGLLRSFFLYPNLAFKTETLEIASLSFSKSAEVRTRYNEELAHRLPHPPEQEFQDQCLAVIAKQGNQVQEKWHQDLADQYLDAYLGVLLAILPNLKKLLLGANNLRYCNMLKETLKLKNARPMDTWRHYARYDGWMPDSPYLEDIFGTLAPKLHTLELPGFWCHSLSPDVSSLTSLRHLALPGTTLDNRAILSLPESLETLVITSGHSHPIAYDFWTRDIKLIRKENLPNLKLVELYFGGDDRYRTHVKKIWDEMVKPEGFEMRLRYIYHSDLFDLLTHGQPHRYTEDELRERDSEEEYILRV
jgi:hypothetical protein